MGKTIIVTSGPTNEPIDAVMKITNMSTGRLGAITASRLLANPEVDKVYYLSTKLAAKPEYNHLGSSGKLHCIEVETTENLMNTLRVLLRNPNEHIDAVVHSAAVGDYTGRYAVTMEDLADEIMLEVQNKTNLTRSDILNILQNPRCTQNNHTKMSSYEPNLLIALSLTPKVIGMIKSASPDTKLIGFKLLESVSQHELFDVACKLRAKNNADYIIANDLSKIGNGRHWSMVIGENGVVTECDTKTEIAEVIERLVFDQPVAFHNYN